MHHPTHTIHNNNKLSIIHPTIMEEPVTGNTETNHHNYHQTQTDLYIDPFSSLNVTPTQTPGHNPNFPPHF